VVKTENIKYKEVDEDFPLGTQEDAAEGDDHELREDGRNAEQEKGQHPKQLSVPVQKKPSLTKEDDYEDDFHDDDEFEEEEIESSADKKGPNPPPAPPAKTPEIPTKSLIDNQK